MIVLQFALESGKSAEFLPEKHDSNNVIYTGTHDNDTILGWYTKQKDKDTKVIKILKVFWFDINMTEKEICWNFIEIAFMSRANMLLFHYKMFYVLDLMQNEPAVSSYGNWKWRFKGRRKK